MRSLLGQSSSSVHALTTSTWINYKLNNPSSNAEMTEICCLWYDGKRGRRGDSKFLNRPVTFESNRIGSSDSNSNQISKLRRSIAERQPVSLDVSDIHTGREFARVAHCRGIKYVKWPIFIARQHTDARYWCSNSVRPSVCPWRSGIRWKRLNIFVIVLSPYGNPIILVLSIPNNFTKYRRGHPLRGR